MGLDLIVKHFIDCLFKLKIPVVFLFQAVYSSLGSVTPLMEFASWAKAAVAKTLMALPLFLHSIALSFMLVSWVIRLVFLGVNFGAN